MTKKFPKFDERQKLTYKKFKAEGKKKTKKHNAAKLKTALKAKDQILKDKNETLIQSEATI